MDVNFIRYYGGRIRRGELTDAAFTVAIARNNRGFDIYTEDEDIDYMAAEDLTGEKAQEILQALKVRSIDGMNPIKLVNTMRPHGKQYSFTVKSSRIGLERALKGISDSAVGGTIRHETLNDGAGNQYLFFSEGTKYEKSAAKTLSAELSKEGVKFVSSEKTEYGTLVIFEASGDEKAEAFLKKTLGDLYEGPISEFTLG